MITRNSLSISGIILAAALLVCGSSPPARAHIERGYMPDSVAEMEYRILLEFKPEDLKSRSLLGMVLLRQDKIAEAEKEFKTILLKKPRDFNSLDALGIIKTKQGKSREAIEILEKAASIAPNDPLVFLHLGQALALESRYDEALEACRKALSKLNKPGTAPAGAAREKRAKQKKKIEEAIQLLIKDRPLKQ